MRPNIVFVFSDQQRYSALGCNGNPQIRTPNFDRLAAEGACFDQTFSSCPICSPYRGQLLTGRYSHANGCVDNEYAIHPDQATLASVLGQAGYRTGYVGKWHLGYGPYSEDKRHGFDYMAAYNCNHTHDRISYHENEEGPFPLDTWGPTGETDLALQFIERHRKDHSDQPFCLLMSWGPPHWGRGTGQGYSEYPDRFNTYDPESIDLPPNVPEALSAFAREEIAHYYGNVTGIDHEFGRIDSFLEENGLAEDTVLCFTSDHGDHLSSHGYGKPGDRWLHPSKRASKATPYEESIHVPFLLRWPGMVSAGRRDQTLVSSVDLMPTLLGLANVEVPTSAQGTDLSSVVLGNGGPEPDSVYLQILGPGWPHRGDWVGFWRGVRTARWTYARWQNIDQVWLFERESDPYEMTNLAGDPEHREVQDWLEARLQRWMQETGDTFETGERDPESGMLRLGQTFTDEKWEDGR